jgi:acyl-CoA thioester hydrolase
MDDSGHTTDVELRYRDLDTMGHVNNAVYATFIEQARLDFFETVAGVPLDEAGGVIAHLEIDYERPITLDQDVAVTTSIADLGDSSISMDHEILADGEVAATANVVQITVDPETGETISIPSEWRDRIATHRDH